MPNNYSATRGMTVAERLSFYSKSHRNGCLIWIGSTNKKGYGLIWVDQKLVLAHRAAWKETHGPIPRGKMVLHSCDNPPCIKDAHLFLGTNQDNMDDMVEKGRHRVGNHKGEASGASAKLTNAKVLRIRVARGFLKHIAKKFGVSKSTVSLIKNRKRWSHL